MMYLSVVKENGVWVIKKQYPNGLNVNGNKTGVLWHRASQMTLQERIDEGIYLQVNKTQGFDPEFSQYVRTDVLFDEVNAEVVYTEVYELLDLNLIKDSLKARTHIRRTFEANKTVEYKNEKFSIDHYMMNTLNNYSAVLSLGGTLPIGAVIPTKHGLSIPLTAQSLLEVQTFIAEYNTNVVNQYIQICAAIDAATTYEEIRLAAMWNGSSV